MVIGMSADWFYPAPVGGPANTIYWQAKALTAGGHEVNVVATSQEVPAQLPRNRWVTLDCGQVIYTRNPHFYLPVNHIRYGWAIIRTADVVHVNSLFYPASLVWVLCCRFLGKPVVWSPHGELNPVALLYRPRLKRCLLRLFRALSAAVVFQATSAEELVQIRQYFGPDAHVREIRTRMALPTPVLRVARPYLLFMGRLHPIKAIDRLLEALGASQLFRESAFSVQLVGPDSDKDYVKKLTRQVTALGLSHKVTFIGAVHGQRKEQLYADAHLLILPSHAESFGNVVIESLAQGTPVIASTHTPWQILDTEGAGQWVPNDALSLRQAIEVFLTMEIHAYERYRTRALELARRDYTSSSAAVLIAMYEAAQALNRPPN